jgi:hypothetical protein
MSSVYMSGGCIERRYFFRMFVVDSGVIMSRKGVERILLQKEAWNMMIDIGIAFDETLGHIADDIGLGIHSQARHQFVGREFRRRHDFETLRLKNFTNLSTCAVPKQFFQVVPGELGVCSTSISRFGDVFAWSGVGEGDPVQFLREAEQMMTGNPDNLGFWWDWTKPVLCLIEPSASDINRNKKIVLGQQY